MNCCASGCRKRSVLEVWERINGSRIIKMYCLIHVPSDKVVLVGGKR